MSRRIDIHYACGPKETYPGRGITAVVDKVPPTDGRSGYAPGCTWQNMAGTVGSLFYVNKGTNLSSDWLNIVSWLVACAVSWAKMV